MNCTTVKKYLQILPGKSFTSKSTLVVSWDPTPLDQNWAIASSIVRPPSTAKEKLLEEGEVNVATLSHLMGLCNGDIYKSQTLLQTPDKDNNELNIENKIPSNVLPEQNLWKIFELFWNQMFSWLPQPRWHQLVLQQICVQCDLHRLDKYMW